jgi:hypothetical protein
MLVLLASRFGFNTVQLGFAGSSLNFWLEVAPDLGGDVREYYTHDTQLSMSLVFRKSARNLEKLGKRQRAKGERKFKISRLKVDRV